MSLIKKFNEEWTMFEKVWIVVFKLFDYIKDDFS